MKIKVDKLKSICYQYGEENKLEFGLFLSPGVSPRLGSNGSFLSTIIYGKLRLSK